MTTYIIYLATNLVNGKQYVGQTKSGRLTRRIFEHKLDALYSNNNNAFHNAILKYGLENFSFEIIEENISEDQIDSREIYWINYYNTFIHAENSNGYNETLGGQGTRGYIFTEADREKMSIKQKQYWANLKENNIEEYNRLCEIRRQNKLGKKWDEASRKKLSESCKGKIPWNKGKKNCQKAWNKGKSLHNNILMLDLNSKIVIATFTNVYEAARQQFPDKLEKTVASHLFTICKKGGGKAYGFFWKFEE